MIDNMLIAAHAFSMRMMKLLLVDEILLSKYRNWFTGFRGLPFNVYINPSCLKRMVSILSELL